MPPKKPKRDTKVQRATAHGGPVDLPSFDCEMEYTSRVSPRRWMLPNRAAFPTWFRSVLAQARPGTDTSTDLMEHQHLAKDFIQPDNPYRGLLLYYGLGVGKTRTAIAAMEAFLKRMRVVIMLPGMLHLNFAEEIQKFGNSVVKLQQRWLFRKAPPDVNRVCEVFNLSANIVRDHGGVWLPSDRGVMFTELSDTQRDQVMTQVTDAIEKTYTFLHYNGIHSNSDIFDNPDFFENKLVLIDEVHGFISGCKSDGPTRKLYDMLHMAHSTKIIALSATPLINDPYELALLANLLHGRTMSVHLTIGSHVSDVSSLRKQLQDDEEVDEVHMILSRHTIEVTLVPQGFLCKDSELGLVEPANTHVAGSRRVMLAGRRLQTIVESNGVAVRNMSVVPLPLLPDDPERFKELFQNDADAKLQNTDLLGRRLQGLVAFYDRRDPDLYPSVSDINLVRLPMSQTQLTEYVRQRLVEIAKEKRRKHKGKPTSSADMNVFKTFTREICNFAFPSQVKRPFKDTVDTDVDYDTELQRATSTLLARASEFLRRDTLPESSPKFAAILDKVGSSPGPTLVYTNFRNLEGIFLLSATFEQNGFEQLKYDPATSKLVFSDPQTPKFIVYDTSVKDYTEVMRVLLAVFNGQLEKLPDTVIQQLRELSGGNDEKLMAKNIRGQWIKTLLVTRSGAEGISLFNVRQVHVMEPHWNEVRIKQVIGRAVRAKSHVQLPPEDRHVDVFMYCMTLPDAYHTDASDKTIGDIVKRDGGLSTDELLINIAKRKTRLTEEAQAIMKDVSLGCHCDGFDKCQDVMLPSHGHVYHANIDLDTLDSEGRMWRPKKIVVTPFDVKHDDGRSEVLGLINGTRFLCDFEGASKRKMVDIIGYADLDPSTGHPRDMYGIFDLPTMQQT